MPQWQLNDPDHDNGWEQPKQQYRSQDRRNYSTFVTFSGRFLTWPEEIRTPTS